MGPVAPRRRESVMVLSPREEILIRAPAKVNLGLSVLRRRRDGYHEIATLFQAVSLYDSLALRRLRKKAVRLVCPDFHGREKENLAYRAAEAFYAGTGMPGGMEIGLQKRIPAGGGLGGGSSDAAAVLLGACRLYGVRPAAMQIHEWAAALGSDVPFFTVGGAAVGTGRGEVIEPLAGEGPPCGVLIYAPGYESPTPEVYGALDPSRLTRSGRRLTMLASCWKKGDPEGLGRNVFNDLEGPVLARHPDLREAKLAMKASGALGALVSGSGSSLFALYRDPGKAAEAARRLRQDLPGKVWAARFIPRRHHWGVVKR